MRRRKRKGKRLRVRFGGIFGVEVGEQERRIGEVQGRFPRGLIGVVQGAFPFDKVLKLLVSNWRVEDQRDFPFDVIKDFERFGWTFMLGGHC